MCLRAVQEQFTPTQERAWLLAAKKAEINSSVFYTISYHIYIYDIDDVISYHITGFFVIYIDTLYGVTYIYIV